MRRLSNKTKVMPPRSEPRQLGKDFTGSIWTADQRIARSPINLGEADARTSECMKSSGLVRWGSFAPDGYLRKTPPPGERDVMRQLHLPMPIWDLPTRLFHWILVVLILTSWLSAEMNKMRLHVICGLSILALLLFRV